MAHPPSKSKFNAEGSVGVPTLESKARAAIEQRTGDPFDDEAWTDAKKRLVEFILTLNRWDREQKADTSTEEHGECETNETAA